MSDLARWLSAEMERNELGVNQVAKYSGISSAMVSNILSGNRNPSAKVVSKLAKYFKVDEDRLLVLAGLRTAKGDEKQQNSIDDPDLRIWATPDNLNNLSEPVKRSIVAIIKTDLEAKLANHKRKPTEEEFNATLDEFRASEKSSELVLPPSAAGQQKQNTKRA